MPVPAVRLEHAEIRRRHAGLSYAELSRRSRVPYRRLWFALSGEHIEDAELGRINQALDQAEQSDPYRIA